MEKGWLQVDVRRTLKLATWTCQRDAVMAGKPAGISMVVDSTIKACAEHQASQNRRHVMRYEVHCALYQGPRLRGVQFSYNGEVEHEKTYTQKAVPIPVTWYTHISRVLVRRLRISIHFFGPPFDRRHVIVNGSYLPYLRPKRKFLRPVTASQEIFLG